MTRVNIKRRVDAGRSTDTSKTEASGHQQKGGMPKHVATRRRAHTRRTEMRGHQEACEHQEAYGVLTLGK